MDEIEEEFRAGLRRAGLAIEDERYDALLKGFAGYRALAAFLDTPPPASLEPAGLYIPDGQSAIEADR